MSLGRTPCENALCAKLINLLRRIAQLGQDLTAVLPDHERRPLDATGCLRQVERQADLIELADERMLVRNHPLALRELRFIVQPQGKARVAALAGHTGP